MVDKIPATSVPVDENVPGSGGPVETLTSELLTAYREAFRGSGELGAIDRKLVEHELRVGAQRIWRGLVTRVDCAEREADDMRRFVDALAAEDTVGKGQALAVGASTRAVRSVALAVLAAGGLAAFVAGREDTIISFALVLAVAVNILGYALPLNEITRLGEPATDLLARTVDGKEAELCRAVGLTPSKRRLVRHAGKLLLGFFALLCVLPGVVVLLVS